MNPWILYLLWFVSGIVITVAVMRICHNKDRQKARLFDWVASHWDSQSLGVQFLFSRPMVNPTGSFKDACESAMQNPVVIDKVFTTPAVYYSTLFTWLSRNYNNAYRSPLFAYMPPNMIEDWVYRHKFPKGYWYIRGDRDRKTCPVWATLEEAVLDASTNYKTYQHV